MAIATSNNYGEHKNTRFTNDLYQNIITKSLDFVYKNILVTNMVLHVRIKKCDEHTKHSL